MIESSHRFVSKIIEANRNKENIYLIDLHYFFGSLVYYEPFKNHLCKSYCKELSDLFHKLDDTPLSEVIKDCRLSRDTHQLQYELQKEKMGSLKPFREIFLYKDGSIVVKAGESTLCEKYPNELVIHEDDMY